jgi:hypothetical protein
VGDTIHADFEAEFDALDGTVQDELLAHAKLWNSLDRNSSPAGRDTQWLPSSEYEGDDGWPVAFAFDPRRQALLMVAGDNSGGSENRFHRQLIAKADEGLPATYHGRESIRGNSFEDLKSKSKILIQRAGSASRPALPL